MDRSRPGNCSLRSWIRSLSRQTELRRFVATQTLRKPYVSNLVADIVNRSIESTHHSIAPISPKPKDGSGIRRYPIRFPADVGRRIWTSRSFAATYGFLGQRRKDKEELQFVPLYERGSLEHIRTDYLQLINSAPREELLQQFLAENPVLLHQFPAERLFPKPPILTFFVADFAVVTQSGSSSSLNSRRQLPGS
jgi:hypothetical protein